MELFPGARLGKYEVVARLAAGGMAEVYLARVIGHAGFARTVALKRMLPELAGESGFRAMFMQEAALAARLSHPHIVQIFDFAEQDGELYLAMEFVHGVTLRRLMLDALASGREANGAPLRVPPLLAANVGRCIARALAYAWQAPDERGQPLHLIHRDVSPQNVLLSHEGDIKLADFGIARPADLRTSVGQLKGKLLYMSPEQLAGATLDARSDVFALGVTIYEAARTLRSPLFEAGDPGAVKEAIRRRKVVPPDRMDPEFPAPLSAVLMKALERDPAQRFQSAAEFAEALSEAIHQTAKDSHEADLVSFMRRLYGPPPPIPCRPPAPPPLPVAPSAVEVSLSELGVEPVAPESSIDPRAPTVRRAALEPTRVLRHEPAPVAAAAAAQVPSPPAARRRAPRTSTALALALGAAAVAAIGFVGLREAPRDSEPLAERSVAQPIHGERPREENAGPTGDRPRAPVVESAAAPAAPRPAPSAAGAAADEPPAIPGARPLSPGPARTAPAVNLSPRPTSPRPRLAAAERATRTAAQPAPAAAAAPSAGGAGDAHARRGMLVVNLRPWGFAWVDGEPFSGGPGQEASPQLRRELPEGEHVVHLRDPYDRHLDVRVRIVAGGEATVVDHPFGAPPDP